MAMSYATNIYMQQNKNATYRIGIASGKGGVGKTQVSVNLAVALALEKKKVVLFDGDFGMGNVTTMLRIKRPEFTLEHVLSGEKKVEDIMLEGPLGIRVVPAGSGVKELLDMDQTAGEKIWEQIKAIEEYGDFLVIDLAGGLAEVTQQFLANSDSILIVITPSLTSIVDAYATIKVVSENSASKIQFMINQYRNDAERAGVSQKIRAVTKKYLDIDIHEVGSLQHDWRVEKSLSTQTPFVLSYPKAKITKSMRLLSAHYIRSSVQRIDE